MTAEELRDSIFAAIREHHVKDMDRLNKIEALLKVVSNKAIGNAPGADVIECTIIKEGFPWRDGKGKFYRAISIFKGRKHFGNVGFKNDVGPVLKKYDKIRCVGTFSWDNYKGIPQFRLFADSVEVIGHLDPDEINKTQK